MQLPAVQKGDELLPVFAAGGYLGYPVVVFFTVGIIAAAFSSADSALAALTTSCCIDLLEVGKMNPDKAVKVRKWVHLLISVLFIGCIVLLEELNSPSIIDTLYVLTSYTYGPLLGLFSVFSADPLSGARRLGALDCRSITGVVLCPQSAGDGLYRLPFRLRDADAERFAGIYRIALAGCR